MTGFIWMYEVALWYYDYDYDTKICIYKHVCSPGTESFSEKDLILIFESHSSI